MSAILHLAPADAWAATPSDAPYRPASLADEGFCHACGDEATLLEVANAFYATAPGAFVVLVVDPALLSSPVVWSMAVMLTTHSPRT